MRFSNGINVLIGDNASGKTSLLEALYFLCTGKSFRSRHIGTVLAHSATDQTLTVTGLIDSAQNAPEQGGVLPAEPRIDALVSPTAASVVHVGIRKSDEFTLIRVGGQTIKSSSQLAYLQPILIFQPDSFELLTGMPGVRRRFLDWGVFHVERSFSQYWGDYQKCLKQRNTLLRNGKLARELFLPWERKLASSAARITSMRRKYFESMRSELTAISELLLPELDSLSFEFIPGWVFSKEDIDRDEESLLEQFERTRQRDHKYRHTGIGAHRCDFRIRIDGYPIEDVLSRGQTKLLTLACFLAHVRAVRNIAGSSTTVLIDDVAAELDRGNLVRVLELLRLEISQVFLTALDETLLISMRGSKMAANESCGIKVFHVEHGKISEG
jgi:DNA replication and repair protein RecF